jgi:hypothetical protein
LCFSDLLVFHCTLEIMQTLASSNSFWLLTVNLFSP